MRIASRVIGVALAFAGVAFFVVSFFIVSSGFDPKSVLEESGPDKTAWMAGAATAAFGAGFILAGRYYFKLNVDERDQERPASRLTSYCTKHRRELKIIAQAGLVISLIRLAATSLGDDWPGKLAALPLSLVSIGLLIIASQIGRGRTASHLDWEQVPQRVRPLLRIIWKAVGPALWILGLLFGWSQWRHQVESPAVQAAIIAILFAWGAMFFAYGEMRPEEKQNALKS
jgi:MFS family permease